MSAFDALSRCDVICEKPLVLEPAHLTDLAMAEADTGHRVYTILQLRHHPATHRAEDIIATRKAEGRPVKTARFIYHTPRGRWYANTWKADPARSGGLIFNIGSHPVDLLIHLFGEPQGDPLFEVVPLVDQIQFGQQFGETWCVIFLSTSAENPRRELMLDGLTIDFCGDTFANLHAECYRAILAGDGPGIDEVRSSIEFCARVRDMMV
jgi:UDP-N-acetyl-2-amino-2-deoxyglucuronate dehydrogenase